MKLLSSRLPLALAVLVAAGCALPGMPGSAPVQPQGVVVGLNGQLEFAFAYPAPAAQRRLLATIADVKRYRLTIKRPDGSDAFGPQEFLAPTPANPKIFIRTPDLPVGSYTALIEALDADGQVISHAEPTVTIEAGICKPVNVTLQLEDNILDPTTGKLGLVVDVQDGAVVQPSTPCCSIPPEYVPLDPAPSATPTPIPSPALSPLPYDGRPIASRSNIEGWLKEEAFQNDPLTGYWTPATSGSVNGDWIGYELATPRKLSMLRLLQNATEGGILTYYVQQVAVEASDSETSENWDLLGTFEVMSPPLPPTDDAPFYCGYDSLPIQPTREYRCYRIRALSEPVGGMWAVQNVLLYDSN